MRAFDGSSSYEQVTVGAPPVAAGLFWLGGLSYLSHPAWLFTAPSIGRSAARGHQVFQISRRRGVLWQKSSQSERSDREELIQNNSSGL